MSEDKYDHVLGAGESKISLGGYKEGENQRYKYCVRFDMPTFSADQTNALAQIGAARVVSVKGSGLFNDKTELGSMEDAEAFAAGFASADAFFAFFVAKKPRAKGEKISGITPHIQVSRECMELGFMRKRGLDPATISPADLKAIRAEVRQHQKDNTDLWQWALAKGAKELALRAKKADDMPD